jgi:hypothetical protein
MKKVLLSILGVSAALAALCMTGCGTEPKGTEGKVLLSDSAAGVSMGTKDPVTVTLKDADLTNLADTLKVTSGADEVGTMLILTGKNGVYTGQLYFSTVASGLDTIMVNNNTMVTVTYKDAKPAGLRTATLIWKGGAVGVALDAATYTGIAAPMTITVTDTNISSATVTVNVSTTTFTTPVPVVLSSAGTFGMYTGKVYFNVGNTLTGADTVHVRNNDAVTVTYSDLVVPASIATAQAKWQGAAVAITTDSAAYNGFEKMMITLTDDHTAATSLVVNVSSAKAGDTIPVTLTAVTATPWIFTGSVGFSLIKTATAVGVQDSDMVMVSYFDSVQSMTASATVNWYSTQKAAFGIFSPNYTAASSLDTSVVISLLSWTNTCTIDTVDSIGENGGHAVAITGIGAWAGFGWADFPGGVLGAVDMSAYAACTLYVSAKSTTAQDFSMLVENNVHTGQTWIAASTVGFLPDGNWHNLAIPLSAWAATCDLTGVDYFLGVSMAPYVMGETLTLDNVYWSLPAAGVAKKRVSVAKVKAK